MKHITGFRTYPSGARYEVVVDVPDWGLSTWRATDRAGAEFDVTECDGFVSPLDAFLNAGHVLDDQEGGQGEWSPPRLLTLAALAD